MISMKGSARPRLFRHSTATIDPAPATPRSSLTLFLLFVWCIVIGAAVPASLVAGWQSAGLTGHEVRDLFQSADGRIYAATDDGLFRSDDQAASWQSAGLGGSIWAVIVRGDGSIFVNTFETILHSLNGSAWEIHIEGALRSLFLSSDDVVFVSGSSDVFRLPSDSFYWLDETMGLPNFPDFQVFANDTEGRVLAGSGGIIGGDVYRSSDGGANWHQLRDGDSGGDALALLALPEDKVLLSVFGLGIVRWDGHAWQETESAIALGEEVNVSALAQQGDRIFAAAFGFGVLISDDGGRTWQADQTDGEAMHDPMTILAAQDGSMLLGGVQGLQRRTSATDLAQHSEQPEQEILSVTHKPTSIEILTSFTHPERLTVTLYDRQGRQVGAAQQHDVAAGPGSTYLPRPAAAAGLYWLRVAASGSARALPLLLAP